jgi:hypothetical protein
MNQHISGELLVGYVYRTLSDAERETIADHLVNCSTCSAQLTYHETRQRQIDYNLQADIEATSLPPEMSFRTIAPRLQRRRMPKFWPQLVSIAPVATAVTGLALALYGLWQALAPLPTPTTPSSLAMTACFCFVLAAVGQFDHEYKFPPRFILSAVLAFVLWSGTAVIGLQNIVIIRNLAIVGFTGISNGVWTSALTMFVVLIASIVYIFVVIGGAEYHYRRIGEAGSWKLFSLTILAELFILLLPYFGLM